jgi:hypothetical protein
VAKPSRRASRYRNASLAGKGLVVTRETGARDSRAAHQSGDACGRAIDRAVFFPDNKDADANPASSPACGQPLTAIRGLGMITIVQGSRAVTTISAASPNIEQTRFISEQNHIVLKSHGNHVPGTVQLFDIRTGRQEGTVMAYELGNGGPTWANGMAVVLS